VATSASSVDRLAIVVAAIFAMTPSLPVICPTCQTLRKCNEGYFDNRNRSCNLHPAKQKARCRVSGLSHIFFARMTILSPVLPDVSTTRPRSDDERIVSLRCTMSPPL
jgi:hypothetical protein